MTYQEQMDWINAHNPYMTESGVFITEIRKDYCTAEAVVNEKRINPYHTAHGGLLFTMADVAAGAAARSDGRSYVTQQASISFVRPGKEGAKLTAESYVIKRGRHISLEDVKIRNEDGKLLLQGTITSYCIADVNQYRD